MIVVLNGYDSRLSVRRTNPPLGRHSCRAGERSAWNKMEAISTRSRIYLDSVPELWTSADRSLAIFFRSAAGQLARAKWIETAQASQESLCGDSRLMAPETTSFFVTTTRPIEADR